MEGEYFCRWNSEFYFKIKILSPKMKLKTPLFFLLLLCFCSSLSAQDCKGFFPFEPGTKFEITYYDKKDRVSSVGEHVVSDITSFDGITAAEMSVVVKDEDGEVVVENDYKVECDEESYKLDLTAMLNESMMQASANMEMEMESDALEFPSNMSVGDELPDGNTSIKMSSNGMKLMTIKMVATNRKVESQEQITTPAGTFDCYKITYDFQMKTVLKKKYKVVQWLSDGVGMVRSETRNKKGKLMSYEVLTKLERE